MASSEEVLKAENAKLLAEIASIKKKTMAALKKQQSEFQAKIQAAEQRALIAEAAAAARAGDRENGYSGSYIVSSRGHSGESDHHNLESSIEGKSAQSLSEVTTKMPENIDNEAVESKRCLLDEIEGLKAELEMERQQVQMQKAEMQRLQEEISESRTYCKELENMRATLLESQNVVEGRKKETGELSFDILLREKDNLAEELHRKEVTLLNLENHTSDIQNRLNILESSASQALDISEEKNKLYDENKLLVTMNSELKAENELLKAQMQEFQSRKTEILAEKCMKNDMQQVIEEPCSVQEDLRKQLQESIAAQRAAEELAEQLKIASREAEEKAADLSLNLEEVQKKMDEEIHIRDEKYTELDSKFAKLQKRAKQHIQGIQKEKEDLETQLAAAMEKANQALMQQTAVQNDLERMRAQAGEALRSLDGERQQLRSSNSRQKEIIEELQISLQTKEHELLEAQRLVSEKEQFAFEISEKRKDLDVKQETAISDMVAKHMKAMLNLESQLADAVQERSKATDTISCLQLQLGKKDAQIAELEAASTGEIVRLTAALEAARGELSRFEQEQVKTQEAWEATYERLRRKAEDIEKSRVQEELAAAKSKGELESELEGHRQALISAQVERDTAREQVKQLEKDFSAYKVRAYSLLQKKEAELLAAKDTDHIAAQEAALQEAQRQAASVFAERDRALKSLQEINEEHEAKLAASTVALFDSEQKIRDLTRKLEAAKTQMLLNHEDWQERLDKLHAAWHLKYEELEAKLKENAKGDKTNELLLIQNDYDKLKEEYESFQSMANTMVEAKDQEISRLLDDISELQKSIHSTEKASKKMVEQKVAGAEEQEDELSNIAAAEQQIFVLARQQAQREEEVTQCHRHIQALQEEIAELEQENRLHAQQESLLKEEFRSLERSRKRDGVDMTYLKNVILKLLETGEVEALLPVIAMLLQFSPDELRRCQDTYSLVHDGAK